MLQMVMQLLCATCQRKKICLNIGMMRMILNLKKDQKSHIQVDLESQNGFKTDSDRLGGMIHGRKIFCNSKKFR